MNKAANRSWNVVWLCVRRDYRVAPLPLFAVDIKIHRLVWSFRWKNKLNWSIFKAGKSWWVFQALLPKPQGHRRDDELSISERVIWKHDYKNRDPQLTEMWQKSSFSARCGSLSGEANWADAVEQIAVHSEAEKNLIASHSSTCFFFFPTVLVNLQAFTQIKRCVWIWSKKSFSGLDGSCCC